MAVVTAKLLKMQDILFVNILHARIINNKGEGDGTGFMEIQGWSVFRREIAISDKGFLELLVGKFTCLFEFIHGATDFDIDASIASHFWKQDCSEH